MASTPLPTYRNKMNDARKSSMAPVGSRNPVLLILGSLPGEASLAAQRYYAHPRNQFWRLLGAALTEPLAELAYQQRLDRLAARGVALWDVVSEAFRLGSLDGALREVRTNRLGVFAGEHPRLGAIAFNGQTAARLGRRALGAGVALRLVDLPSSSPAFTLAFAAKAERWAMLGELALPPESATLKR